MTTSILAVLFSLTNICQNNTCLIPSIQAELLFLAIFDIFFLSVS